jgi:hypothetical protein
MQAHPDRAELKAYLRGRLQSAEAGVIKAHLLTCDQCVSDAVLECDYLDQMRARFSLRSERHAIQPVISTTQPAAIAATQQAGMPHAWAALIPMTLAVAFLFNSRDLQERPLTIVQARSTSIPIEQPGLTLPAAQQETEDIADEGSSEADGYRPAEVVPAVARSRVPQPQVRIRRGFILSQFSTPSRPTRHPVLLGPADFDRPVVLSSVSFHKSEALTLVASEPSLSPPPRRKNGFRRFFSAFAAPFRG